MFVAATWPGNTGFVWIIHCLHEGVQSVAHAAQSRQLWANLWVLLEERQHSWRSWQVIIIANAWTVSKSSERNSTSGLIAVCWRASLFDPLEITLTRALMSLLSFCLAVVCIRIVAHVKDPTSTF